MRKCATTLVLVFAFAAYGAAWQAGAQNPADSSQSPAAQQPADQAQQPSGGHQSSMAGEQNSISGCLRSSAAGDGYTLQTEQGAVQLKAESELKQEFDKHVGQQIRVTGAWAGQESQETASNRDQGAQMPQADQPNAGESAQARTFSAEEVDVISPTCTTSGMQQETPRGMSPGAPPESRGPEEAPQQQTTQPPANQPAQ